MIEQLTHKITVVFDPGCNGVTIDMTEEDAAWFKSNEFLLAVLQMAVEDVKYTQAKMRGFQMQAEAQQKIRQHLAAAAQADEIQRKIIH